MRGRVTHWLTLLGLFLVGGAFAAEDEQRWDAPQTIPGSITVSAEEMIRLVGEYPDVVIVDSRVPTNRNRGYIEGSISLGDTETNCDSLDKLLSGKEQPVVFHCNGPQCQRSSVAVKIAVSCGYQKVYWFRGGIQEWEAKDFPLRRD